MAAAKIFNNNNVTAGALNISSAGNNSTGSTLLVVIVTGTPGGSLSCSDSQGGGSNTYVQIGSTVTDSGSNLSIAFFYCKSPTHAGASHSFTGSNSVAGVAVWCLGFSGTDQTQNVLCNGSTDNGVSTVGNTGSCSPGATHPGSVFVALTSVSGNGNLSLTVGSGFTLLDFSNGTVTFDARNAYKIQTGAAASENPLFTTSGAEEKLCFIASFAALAQTDPPFQSLMTNPPTGQLGIIGY